MSGYISQPGLVEIGVAHATPLLKNLDDAQSLLRSSMQRVASANRLEDPGFDPVAYQLALSSQTAIRSRDALVSNLQSQKNLQEQQGDLRDQMVTLLGNMSNLVIQLNDTSLHAQADQVYIEFNLLMDELKQQSQTASFNGIYSAGSNQIAAYDAANQQFVISNVNGNNDFTIDYHIATGHHDTAGNDFLFAGTQDFIVTQDGDGLVYCDNNGNMVRYSISSGILSRDTTVAHTGDLHIVSDENNLVYFSNETAPGSGIYTLNRQDPNLWCPDAAFAGTTAVINAMASREIAVYNDNVYYLDSSQSLIQRSLLNPNEISIVRNYSTEPTPLNTAKGQFTISPDGMYTADVISGSQIRVIDSITGNRCTGFTLPGVTITDLSFDTTENNVIFRDSVKNEIYRISLKIDPVTKALQPGDSQEIIPIRAAAGFSKLATSSMSVPVGYGIQYVEGQSTPNKLSGLDLRPYTLGIARCRVDEATPAALSKLLDELDVGNSRLTQQGVILGLQQQQIDNALEGLFKKNELSHQFMDELQEPNLPEEISIQTHHQGRIMMIMRQLQMIYNDEQRQNYDLMVSAFESLEY